MSFDETTRRHDGDETLKIEARDRKKVGNSYLIFFSTYGVRCRVVWPVVAAPVIFFVDQSCEWPLVRVTSQFLPTSLAPITGLCPPRPETYRVDPPKTQIPSDPRQNNIFRPEFSIQFGSFRCCLFLKKIEQDEESGTTSPHFLRKYGFLFLIEL